MKTALERARDLMFEVVHARNGADRIALAERALRISPDCADAYSLLAEVKARSAEEACSYYEKGVEAGGRALGARAFREDVGRFWGLIETRPYMRARAGLADSLWTLGREEEALDHWQDMLRLNPSDNQGVRDLLLTRLLARDHHDEAGELIERYADDASALWLYSRALWLYRSEGSSERAEEALVEALGQNDHVPAYLLGERDLPTYLPVYVGWGDDTEARAYAVNGMAVWTATTGATDWLRQTRTRNGVSRLPS